MSQHLRVVHHQTATPHRGQNLLHRPWIFAESFESVDVLKKQHPACTQPHASLKSGDPVCTPHPLFSPNRPHARSLRNTAICWNPSTRSPMPTPPRVMKETYWREPSLHVQQEFWGIDSNCPHRLERHVGSTLFCRLQSKAAPEVAENIAGWCFSRPPRSASKGRRAMPNDTSSK